MKTIAPVLRLCVLTATLLHGVAHGEDIDLYAGVTGTVGAPNVLFFIDNSANWSSNAQSWTKATVQAKCTSSANPTQCTDYVNTIFGSASSLLQGQVELRALKLVLNNLVCGTSSKMTVNAGLMLLNDQGTVDSNSAISGYIRRHIDVMKKGSAQCSTMLADLDNIDSKITNPDFKGPASAQYGGALYEAFKYFGGWTNPAGASGGTAGTSVGATGFGPVRNSKPIAAEDPLAFTDAGKTTYQNPISGTNVCGNNYIVLIGNAFPNQEWGTDTNASPNPTNTLLTRLSYNAGPQIYPVPLKSSDKSKVRFADEWAAFLYKTDVSSADGIQNIRMFTLDVYNAKSDADQTQLLTSIADQSGPGGHFTVGGDLYGMITAFTDILTQIAAVNSVFSAASLPVSVNTQGSYVNQVFMGVFRPDGNSQQRWMGNLRQYKFALDDSGALFLADKFGKSAVDSQNTGFLQNCGTSYWTTDSGAYWQNITGYSTPSNCSTSLYSPYSDAPDGPIVERGGAAERLRNLGYTNRNIRTCDSTTCSNTTLIDFTLANMSSRMGSTLAASLVPWLRGQNVGDGSINAQGITSTTQYGLEGTATRPTVHGDIVHSRPLAINYGVNGSDDVVVFYGAGDGMLHAVDGNQEASGASPTNEGNELWAFIAPEHWAKSDRVRTNSPLIAYPNLSSATILPTPQPRSWFFDGSISGYQERTASGISKIWIYPTMRRGGNSVYGFDVTNRPSSDSTKQPKVLWRYDDSATNGDTRMGQSWSAPTVIRVKGISSPLVVFGAGYDNCEDDEAPASKCSGITKGKGIVIVDAEKGKAQNYRFIGVTTNELDSSAGRFVADVVAVDVDRDGYTDVLYAADTAGNVWRINTSNPNANFAAYTNGVADWPVNKIAAMSNWGADKGEWRKFMYAPSTVTLATATSSTKQVTVLIGSGDREKPSATSNAALVKNRFYGIFDDVTKVTPATITIADGVGSSSNMKDVTGSDYLDPATLASYRGWYLNLASSVAPYEQVVTTPLTIAGETFFNTFQAKSSSPNACLDLGTARGYRINFQTGTAIKGYPLSSVFVSPGFPPSPVGGTVLVNGVRVPFVLGGQGKTPILPEKLVPKVNATRTPLYRYKRVD